MAENESITPEQQLLKLIEGQKPGSPAPKGQAPASKRPRFSFGKFPGALAASLSFWKRRAGKKRSGKGSPFGIAQVNRALVAAVAALFLYVLFDAAASARNLQKPPSFAPIKEMRSKNVKETVAPLNETSYYLEKVSSRDIFKEGLKQTAIQQAPTLTVTETAGAVKNLQLVGISWSSNPDAIIEDSTKQRTYFVKRGQEAGDGVKVEAIFKDHVVVTFEDREYELR